MKITKALQTIVDNANKKSLGYAVNYAKAGLTMERDSPEFRTQLLYIRANLSYWRGDIAKKVRKAIDNELSM